MCALGVTGTAYGQGFMNGGAINGTCYLDQNQNGQMDDNETGMAGAGFIIAGPHSIQFTLDFHDGGGGDGDGDVTDADENITYGFSAAGDADGNGRADSGAAPIMRVTAGNDRLAENIHAIGFA